MSQDCAHCGKVAGKKHLAKCPKLPCPNRDRGCTEIGSQHRCNHYPCVNIDNGCPVLGRHDCEYGACSTSWECKIREPHGLHMYQCKHLARGCKILVAKDDIEHYIKCVYAPGYGLICEWCQANVPPPDYIVHEKECAKLAGDWIILQGLVGEVNRYDPSNSSILMSNPSNAKKMLHFKEVSFPASVNGQSERKIKELEESVKYWMECYDKKSKENDNMKQSIYTVKSAVARF